MSADPKLAELAGIIREIRERVRSKYPEGQPDGLPVPLPDLLPVMHARDAAEAKVASIGGVNPRPPGLANSIIQSIKRNIARSLNWFVRDQIEFNRASVSAIDAVLHAMNDSNRAIVALNARIEEQRGDALALRGETRELKDIRSHWIHWREEWQQKLIQNEAHFLKSVAELQASYHHRATLMEQEFRETVRRQHGEFTGSLQREISAAVERFWKDLDRIRLDYERLIHHELRTLRQRALTHPALLAETGETYDPARLAECFRGPEEHIRHSQRIYEPFFRGRRNVLDIGCGRGEFLELMREFEVPARGIDLDAESVSLCRAKGLTAETADLYEHLRRQPAQSLDGIFCAQVVEHLPPRRVGEFLRLAHEVLEPGGLLAIETPNPESLAIFATHFYLDPTHQKPIPPALLGFYFQEAGFGRLETLRLSPAVETLPELAELPEGVRTRFFGALDYAVIGRRL